MNPRFSDEVVKERRDMLYLLASAAVKRRAAVTYERDLIRQALDLGLSAEKVAKTLAVSLEVVHAVRARDEARPRGGDA